MENDLEKWSLDKLKKRNKFNLFIQGILYGLAIVIIFAVLTTKMYALMGIFASLLILGFIMNKVRQN